MKKITIKKLIMKTNINIIDVRDEIEFQKFHLNNSINITFIELYYNYKNYLNTNTTYYIICETGKRSKKISKFLYKLGYDVYYVTKGIKKIKQL